MSKYTLKSILPLAALMLIFSVCSFAQSGGNSVKIQLKVQPYLEMNPPQLAFTAAEGNRNSTLTTGWQTVGYANSSFSGEISFSPGSSSSGAEATVKYIVTLEVNGREIEKAVENKIGDTTKIPFRVNSTPHDGVIRMKVEIEWQNPQVSVSPGAPSLTLAVL